HFRRLHMRHQGYARSPEAAVLGSAGDLLAELGRELAMDGRDVHTDLLEDAAAHDAHHPAAAARPVPGLALEATGRPTAQGTGQFVIELLEGGADAVAQG